MSKILLEQAEGRQRNQVYPRKQENWPLIGHIGCIFGQKIDMNFNLRIQFLQEGMGEGKRDAQIMLNSDFEATSLEAATAFGEEVSALFSEKYGFVPEFYRPYQTIVSQMGAPH